MSPGISGESAALQALIKGNLRVLYPEFETEVVTYRDEYSVRACAVQVPGPKDELKCEVLVEGTPGDIDWGWQESLESLFRKTQKLLGSRIKPSTTPG